MGEAALLEVRGLSKSYGGKLALQDVDVTVERGSILGLIGPNGAGKTTLSACISGEIPATGGVVRYQGREITGLSPTQRARRGIGRSFQVSHIFADLTVAENVAVAAEGVALRPLRAMFGRRWQTDLDALAAVGLDDRRDAPASSLAQADRKRLELAMVIAMEPELVILDEPTAGMGSSEAVECAELLKRINEQRGTTMIITEHNMSVMFHLADRITVLDQGCVVMSGDPQSVRSDARLKTIYFGEMPTAEA